MPAATVRISDETRKTLRKLAARKGVSMQAMLGEAVEEYRRRRFLDEANAAFAALRANCRAWEAELEERRAWDNTLDDGKEEK
ncbi:MAG: toxin-antitoxin system protein [Acidobacteriota bacterium]